MATKNTRLLFILAIISVLLGFTGCGALHGETLPGGEDVTNIPTITEDTTPAITQPVTEAPTIAPTPSPTDAETTEHPTTAVAPTEPPTTAEPSTEAPTQAPIVDVTPPGRSAEVQGMIVPSGGPVADDYFTDSVFLGDSVTQGLEMYMTRQRKTNPGFMSNARFICGKSYGVLNALRPVSDSSNHPVYEGEQMLPEDQLKKMGAKKVFISFGLNDIRAVTTVPTYTVNYAKLINRIREVNPDIQIVLLSVSPLTESSQKPDLNNAKIMEYCNAMIQTAHDLGCQYVDVGAALRDAAGNLPDDISSDGYCHLVSEGYDKYYNYLITHPAVPKTE